MIALFIVFILNVSGAVVSWPYRHVSKRSMFWVVACSAMAVVCAVKFITYGS